MSDVSTIGEACNITTGKLDSNHAVDGGEYPFFTCSATPSAIDNFAFDDEVVLIAGNNAQGNFHVSRYSGKFNAYQRTYVLTEKLGYSLDYIYYSLKLELQRLKKRSQGSQTKFLTMPILTSIVLRDADYEEQKSIAGIVANIDKKIEINNRINTELEAMAKTLYDYWFVQFDFPDENGNPYKSSGGKMVYSEELKREIPAFDGWQVSSIGAELSTTLGGTPSTKEPDYWDGEVSWLNSGEIAEFPVIDSEKTITKNGVKNSAAEVLPIGSVVVSIVRYIRPSILGIQAATSQSVVGLLESKHLRNSFIYPHLKNDVPRLMSLRAGAQQPHINKKTIDSSPIVVPAKNILKKYYRLADPIYKQISTKAFETHQLTKLRDWLLPMLMNGQVKVTIPKEKQPCTQ